MVSFDEKCYNVLRKVPKGKITTYKAIAKALHSKAFRAVGNAMNKNNNKNIPCHRVIKSNGFIGGYNRGIKNKIKILKQEGITIKNNKINLKLYEYKFK